MKTSLQASRKETKMKPMVAYLPKMDSTNQRLLANLYQSLGELELYDSN